MIKLETEFTYKGMNFEQVIRNDQFAIYEVTKEGKLRPYEVIKIIVHPKGFQIFDKILDDDQENYPGSASWGIHGWTCVTLKEAIKKYKELTNITNDIVIEPTIKHNDSMANEVKETPKPLNYTLNFPDKEFTVGELATFNSTDYSKAFLYVKECIMKNIVKFVREERRNAKGKASKIYSKI